MSATCPTCGHAWPGHCPPEPPVGTWVRDRHGGATMRHEGGGWAPPGCMPFGVWEMMWAARGPLEVCGPWGAPLDPETTEVQATESNI